MTIAEMLDGDSLGDLEAQFYEQMTPKELERFHSKCETYAQKYQISIAKSALELLLEIYNGRPPRE